MPAAPINLYVDVRSIDGSDDSSYQIEFYRMGWYNGVGGRKMSWYDSATSISRTSKLLSSVTQPIPEVDLSNGGVVDCLATTANGHTVTPWSLSYTLNVPSWWLSGVYVAKLTTATTSKQSYIIFVVREDSRGSDLYFKTSDATWQAYNPWGGNSLYPYPRYNDCSGNLSSLLYATNVSYNRPYAPATCHSGLEYGAGAGEFFVIISQDATAAWECNALRWMEKQAYDVTYCSCVDTHSGSLLNKSVKAFLSIGHDEYWSPEMRSSVETARDRTTNPINLVFLTGNACYRRIHFATGLRSFTCDKFNSPFDLWRRLTTSPNHEATMVGIETVALGYGGPIVVSNPSGGHWAFDFTSIGAGSTSSLQYLGGIEADGCYVTNPCYSSVNDLHLAQCPTWSSTTIKLADTVISDSTCSTADCHSYALIYTATSGGRVFATGGMRWNWGLDDYGYSTSWLGIGSAVNSVARQMTHNILQTFSGKSRTQLP
jgi:hypothetical protein